MVFLYLYGRSQQKSVSKQESKRVILLSTNPCFIHSAVIRITIKASLFPLSLGFLFILEKMQLFFKGHIIFQGHTILPTSLFCFSLVMNCNLTSPCNLI